MEDLGLGPDEHYTALGAYLIRHQIPASVAAVELGITRSYISMLTRGHSNPGLELAGLIEDWSHGEVPMRTWYDWMMAKRTAARAALGVQIAGG